MINIYQVLPRLLTNTKGKNVNGGTIKENGCGKLNDITEKVINGIQAKGYTHIWLTGVIEHATQTDYSKYGIEKDQDGVVKGKAGSPYAIKDYYDIDPDLAVDVDKRMKEFEALVKRIHKCGMKVIIDFVPNHVARRYHSDAKKRNVKDLGEGDDITKAFDPQNNFYYIPGQPLKPQFDVRGYEEMPAKATGNDVFNEYPGQNDWYETVKLNYGVDYVTGHRLQVTGEQMNRNEVPDTWKKMTDILKFWAKKGVDGFRCDMAEMVPVEFWHYAIEQVKDEMSQVTGEDNSIIFIAEVYNPQEYRSYINYGGFDYLYDKVGMYDTLRAVSRGELSASAITGAWQATDDIKDHMLNFLENHDEQRIASDYFLGDGNKAEAALMVSALLSDAPFMVYAGQEYGEKGMDEEGFSGRDGRTTIFDYWKVDTLNRWMKGKLTKKEEDLSNRYSRILGLRKELGVGGKRYDLQWMNYDNPKFDGNKLYAFIRNSGCTLGKDLIVVNFSDEDEECELRIGKEAVEYMRIDNNVVSEANGDVHTLREDEDGGKWLKLKVKAHKGTVVRLENLPF